MPGETSSHSHHAGLSRGRKQWEWAGCPTRCKGHCELNLGPGSPINIYLTMQVLAPCLYQGWGQQTLQWPLTGTRRPVLFTELVYRYMQSPAPGGSVLFTSSNSGQAAILSQEVPVHMEGTEGSFELPLSSCWAGLILETWSFGLV